MDEWTFCFFWLRCYISSECECARMRVRPFFGHILKWTKKSRTFRNETPNEKYFDPYVSLQHVAEQWSHFHSWTFKCLKIIQLKKFELIMFSWKFRQPHQIWTKRFSIKWDSISCLRLLAIRYFWIWLSTITYGTTKPI